MHTSSSRSNADGRMRALDIEAGTGRRSLSVNKEEQVEDSNAKNKGRRMFLPLVGECRPYTQLLAFLLVSGALVVFWWSCIAVVPVPNTVPSRSIPSHKVAPAQVTTTIHSQERTARPRKKPETSAVNWKLDADICHEVIFDDHAMGGNAAIPLVHNNVSVEGFVREGSSLHTSLLNLDVTRSSHFAYLVFGKNRNSLSTFDTTGAIVIAIVQASTRISSCAWSTLVTTTTTSRFSWTRFQRAMHMQRTTELEDQGISRNLARWMWICTCHPISPDQPYSM